MGEEQRRGEGSTAIIPPSGGAVVEGLVPMAIAPLPVCVRERVRECACASADSISAYDAGSGRGRLERWSLEATVAAHRLHCLPTCFLCLAHNPHLAVFVFFYFFPMPSPRSAFRGSLGAWVLKENKI